MFKEREILTAAPAVEPRTVGGRLIGFYRAGSTWSAVGCPSIEGGRTQGLTTSGTYFACADVTETDFGIATTCLQGGGLPNPTGTFTCGNGSCCQVALYIDLLDTNPYMAYACGICHSTLFRETFDVDTATSTGNSVTFPTSTSNFDSTTTSLLSSPTSGPSSSFPSNTSRGSTSTSSTATTAGPGISAVQTPAARPAAKTWIAGAVIAPIAAILVIGGLAFWVWKLKKIKSNREAPERVVYYDPSGKAELATSGHQSGVHPRGAELDQRQQIVEAPDTGYRRELPGR